MRNRSGWRRHELVAEAMRNVATLRSRAAAVVGLAVLLGGFAGLWLAQGAARHLRETEAEHLSGAQVVVIGSDTDPRGPLLSRAACETLHATPGVAASGVYQMTSYRWFPPLGSVAIMQASPTLVDFDGSDVLLGSAVLQGDRPLSGHLIDGKHSHQLRRASRDDLNGSASAPLVLRPPRYRREGGGHPARAARSTGLRRSDAPAVRASPGSGDAARRFLTSPDRLALVPVSLFLGASVGLSRRLRPSEAISYGVGNHPAQLMVPKGLRSPERRAGVGRRHGHAVVAPGDPLGRQRPWHAPLGARLVGLNSRACWSWCRARRAWPFRDTPSAGGRVVVLLLQRTPGRPWRTRSVRACHVATFTSRASEPPASASSSASMRSQSANVDAGAAPRGQQRTGVRPGRRGTVRSASRLRTVAAASDLLVPITPSGPRLIQPTTYSPGARRRRRRPASLGTTPGRGRTGPRQRRAPVADGPQHQLGVQHVALARADHPARRIGGRALQHDRPHRGRPHQSPPGGARTRGAASRVETPPPAGPPRAARPGSAAPVGRRPPGRRDRVVQHRLDAFEVRQLVAVKVACSARGVRSPTRRGCGGPTALEHALGHVGRARSSGSATAGDVCRRPRVGAQTSSATAASWRATRPGPPRAGLGRPADTTCASTSSRAMSTATMTQHSKVGQHPLDALLGRATRATAWAGGRDAAHSSEPRSRAPGDGPRTRPRRWRPGVRAPAGHDRVVAPRAAVGRRRCQAASQRT